MSGFFCIFAKNLKQYKMEEKEIIITDEKLKKVIETIKKNCNDYLVVGSIALNVCGLQLDREPNDIDILVKCGIGQDSFFRELDNMNREDTTASDAKCFKFKVCDVPINVWVVKELPTEYVMKDDIKYGTVMYILKEKLSYKREKDYKDLITILSKMASLVNIEKKK